MTMHVKVSGAYKQCAPKVKVDGSYKTVEKGWVKVGGVYKLFYQAGSGVIDLVGTVSTVLGNGTNGTPTGSGTSTPIIRPVRLAVGKDGYIYYADNDSVLHRFDLATFTPAKFTFTKPVTTTHVITGAIATAWPGVVAGQPMEIFIAPDETIYISSSYRIFRISGGNLELVAGAPTGTAISSSSGTADGTGTTARFLTVAPNMTWGHDDALYVTDARAVRKVTTAGVVTTVAGSMTTTGNVDDTGTAARFSGLNGIVYATDGSYYINEVTNNKIRRMTTGLVVTTFKSSYSLVARSFVTSPDGNLYGRRGDALVRVAMDGTATSMAGVATGTGYVDGTGTTARFSAPFYLSVAEDGTIYVSDTLNDRIRKVV